MSKKTEDIDTKFIIGQNGELIDLKDSSLIDEAGLSDADKEILEDGQDDARFDLGMKAGIGLPKILEDCGYGDLNYRNSIACTPQTLRFEINERYDNRPDDKLLQTAAKLTDKELDELGAAIASNEEIWEVWNNIFSQELQAICNKKVSKKRAGKRK